MFFENLKPLLKGASSLTILVTPQGDELLQVVVVAKGDFKDKALANPVPMLGTAKELDEGFAEAIMKVKAHRESLMEQMNTTVAILEAARKDQAEKAKDKLKGKAGSSAAKPSSAPAAHVDDPEDDLDDGGEQQATTEQSNAKPNHVDKANDQPETISLF